MTDADPLAWTRRAGEGAYARVERERRFLVDGPVPEGQARRLVEDRYLQDSRLRLRRVTAGDEVVRKLTQKVRPDDTDPAEVRLTNTYLSESEYRLLSSLPGAELVKTRAVVVHRSRAFVVDEFGGPLQGLRLAEVEVRDLDEVLDLPDWLGREVTHDDRFSGGRLCRLDRPAAQRLLAQLR